MQRIMDRNSTRVFTKVFFSKAGAWTWVNKLEKPIHV